MLPSVSKYWRFQGRALLTRLGLWQRFECWRLRRRFQRGMAHESDFAFFHYFNGGDQLFVDIGANIGQSAFSFRLANRHARILSFEPNPDMEAGLRVVKQILGSSFDYRIHGLGAHTQVKPLFVPVVKGIAFPQNASFCRERLTNNPEIGELFRAWTGTDRFDIVERSLMLVRFDELELAPAFVKIDVEGAEADVIAGMDETLHRCRPVLLIEGYGARSILRQRQYVELIHDAARNQLRQAGPGEGALNVFYVPAERIDELVRIGAIVADVVVDRAA